MSLQSHSWAYIWKKNMIRKDTCTPTFTAAQITTAKTWTRSKHPSTEEWIKKEGKTFLKLPKILNKQTKHKTGATFSEGIQVWRSFYNWERSSVEAILPP